MSRESTLRRYSWWYSRLVRLYPKPFRERFGDEMVRTFQDMCGDAESHRLIHVVVRAFIDTACHLLREHVMKALIENRRAVVIMIVMLVVWSLPLVAMKLTDGMNWGIEDFVVFGLLLTGIGVAAEWSLRTFRSTTERLAVGLAITTGAMIILSDLAVGIIGNEGHPANLMFFAVLGLGLAGAFLERFRPRGMARMLWAAAAAQALVPAVAMFVWNLPMTPGLQRTFLFNTVFAASFAVAGLMFRHSARNSTTVRTSA